MAEKITLAEVDINYSNAVQDTIKLKEEIKLLTSQTAKALDEQGELSAEYIQYSAALKGAQADLKTNERLLVKLSQAGIEEAGTLQKLEAENAKLRAEQKKLNLETEEGRKLNEQYNEQINKNTEFIKGNVDQRKKELMNVGNYPGAFGKMSEAINSTVPAFGKASAAAKAFLANPIGIILTAIVAVVGLLVKAFKKSEESMNKVKTVTGGLSGVFNLLLKGLKPVVGFIADVVIVTFETLGKIAEKTLGLVSKGLKFLGFDNAAKSVDNFTQSMKDAAKGGMELAMMEAELQKSQRQANKLQLDYQKQAEKLRQIRDDESKSIAERIKANEDLGKVLNEQSKAELAIANQSLAIAQKRIQLEGESTENLDALAEAETRIADIQERITGQQSEQLVNINSLRKEAAEKEKERLAAKVEQEKAATEKAIDNLENELKAWQITNKSKLENSELLSQDLIDNEVRRLEESAKKEMEVNKAKLDAGLISQSDYNLAKLQLESDNNQAIADLNSEFKQQQNDLEIERLIVDHENKMELLSYQLSEQWDIQRQQLELQRLEEIKNAEKTGADINLINKKYAQADKAIEQAKFAAKLGLYQNFASNVAALFEQNTILGKIAGSASVAISSYQGAMDAYSAAQILPPPAGQIVGTANAAAVIALGVKNIQKIWAVDPKSGVNSISGDTASTSTGTVSTNGLVSNNTDIGAGIISRETSSTQQQQSFVAVVVDDVTRAQNIQSKSKSASVI